MWTHRLQAGVAFKFSWTLVFLQDQAISARELQQMLNGVLSRRKGTFVPNSLFDFYSAQIIQHTILWRHERPAGLFLGSEQLLGDRGSQYSQPRNSSAGSSGPGREQNYNFQSLDFMLRRLWSSNHNCKNDQRQTWKHKHKQHDRDDCNHTQQHNRTTWSVRATSDNKTQQLKYFSVCCCVFCNLHIRATEVPSTISSVT